MIMQGHEHSMHQHTQTPLVFKIGTLIVQHSPIVRLLHTVLKLITHMYLDA